MLGGLFIIMYNIRRVKRSAIWLHSHIAARARACTCHLQHTYAGWRDFAIQKAINLFTAPCAGCSAGERKEKKENGRNDLRHNNRIEIHRMYYLLIEHDRTAILEEQLHNYSNLEKITNQDENFLVSSKIFK